MMLLCLVVLVTGEMKREREEWLNFRNMENFVHESKCRENNGMERRVGGAPRPPSTSRSGNYFVSLDIKIPVDKTGNQTRRWGRVAAENFLITI